MRRAVMIFTAGLLLSATLALAASDPAATLTAIYERVAAGNKGGSFLWVKAQDRRRYFSQRTAKLWDDAAAKTPEGDEGPIGFDPITNSQDPVVKAFEVKTERADATTATIVVAISSRKGPIKAQPGNTLRYDLVREGDRWMIDDIRGSMDGDWSLRQILADAKG
jgi:hypothetical protein